DEELVAVRDAGRVVMPGPDPRTVAVRARPGDEEVAVVIDRDARMLLVAGRGRVGPEFAALALGIVVKALAVGSPAASVLALAGPDNHEVAAIVHAHHGIALVAEGERVDPELAALGRAVVVILPRVDAPTAAVLALAGPRDDEVTIVVH